MSKTVLDEWVVQLGFDVAGLAKGQTDALARLDAIEKGADKSRKNIEASNKKTGESFEAITRGVFRLTTAFVGFSAIKAAVIDITKADIAVGRFAANIDAPIGKLKALRSAAGEFGVASAEIDAALQASADVIAKKANGIMPSSEYQKALGRLGIDQSAFYDKGINDLQRFKLVQDAVNKSLEEHRMTRMQAIQYAGEMGYSGNVVAMMIQTDSTLGDLIDKYENLNTLTEADNVAALKRAQAWNTATNAMEHYWRTAINGVTELASAEVRAAREKEGDRAPATVGRVLESAAIIAGDIVSDPLSTAAESGAQAKLDAVWAGRPIATGKIVRPAPSANQSDMPRNERNNNPGNLEYGPRAQRFGATGSDGRFAIFPTLGAGIAAQRDLLRSYGKTNSIANIIAKYAPPSENDTAAYSADVSRRTGFGSRATLDMQDPAVLNALQMAMSAHEGLSPRGLAAMQADMPGGSSSTSSTVIHNLTVNAGSANGRDVAAGINNGNTVRNALALNASGSGM